jgi:acetyl-CoA acetyltransferase/uncharacterized OB-fold protein
MLPEVTPETEAFWTGGADGELRIYRCQDCRGWIHPPSRACWRCRSQAVGPETALGRGKVAAFTVNYHPWLPGFPPPYVIAVIELEESPDVRLTSNVIGCDVEEVHVGMPGAARRRMDPAVSAGRKDLLMTFVENRAVISGIGQSQIGRRIGRTGLDLGVEAAVNAIADAGLTADDIDGVASYPGPVGAEGGFVGATTHDLRNALGLRSNWYTSGVETAGQIGTLLDACAAVASGRATHVLAFRSVWEATAQAAVGRAAAITGYMSRASGHLAGRLPYGAASAANWIAIMAQRYMYEHGLTRKQLGNVAINARRNAALNPNAIFTAPMTLEDYLGARMISYPFGLFDCDIPADGATAIIISRREATAGLRRSPLTIEAAGSAMYERHSWDQRADLTTMAAHDAADAMWKTTKFTPQDVDFATLYDGFTYLTLQWIDAFGFCEHGKAGHFLEDVDRFSKDGDFPINPHGGQLSAGRLHGYGFLHEACVQLWGEGGDRQITKDVSLAAVGIGGGPEGGCLLLRRDA